VKIEQVRWQEHAGWMPADPGAGGLRPQLVLVFGSSRLLRGSEGLAELAGAYPGAIHFGCSTAGEIFGTEVRDETLVATAIEFEHTRVQAAHAEIGGAEHSFTVGERLARSLPHAGLQHAFALSDGLGVNGSDLVRGLKAGLPDHVTVTGGLSADGARFEHTLLVWERAARSGTAGIVGFYGDRLAIGYGSLGGWDPFGPERLITKSSGNVLFELDGRSALGLYKDYLGPHAHELPSAALLFPLSVRAAQSEPPVVRTILGIDEERRSMTFAGDMPTGAYARLMKANFDRLVDGATGAARTCTLGLRDAPPELAILISCVGRKLVLQQRVEEEVEAVRAVLGARPVLSGFYSYGEISPFTPTARCELHNQTMTITTFSEAGTS
jgi:hypothetical protein